MIKRLQDFWEWLRRDRGQLKATVRVEFYLNKGVTPTVTWNDSDDPGHDTVTLTLFLYARILYELAEINETRTAKELMGFISQVVDKVLMDEGPPNRPRLPLGGLHLEEEPPVEPVSRAYQADFYQLQDGQYRMDFKGSLGKEGVYLPAAYVVFLQDCINRLEDEALRRLAEGHRRLHAYYKFRRDFWDSSALTTGPVFALGEEALRPEEAEMAG